MSVRSLFVFALALIALCSSSVASAAGRTQWKSKTFKERSDKAWNLEVAIYLPSAPDVPHVPMKFEFQPEVYYERDMMDGDKLVERKVPLDNRQALIESVDVEFLDSGTGKIEPRTRFTFKLTRAHGYEAGEYKVSIHDGRNDQAVGTARDADLRGRERSHRSSCHGVQRQRQEKEARRGHQEGGRRQGRGQEGRRRRQEIGRRQARER